MAGRGRGGRFGGWGGNSRGKSVASGRGGGDASALARVLNTADCCACVSNGPLLVELKNLDEECLRTGKVKLRYVLPLHRHTQEAAAVWGRLLIFRRFRLWFAQRVRFPV